MNHARKIQKVLKGVAVSVLGAANLWAATLAIRIAVLGIPGRWILQQLRFLMGEVHLLPFLPAFQPIQVIPILRDADRLTQLIQYGNIMFAALAVMALTTVFTTLIAWVLLLDIPQAIARWYNTFQAHLAHRQALSLLRSLEDLDFNLMPPDQATELVPIRDNLRQFLGDPDAGMTYRVQTQSRWRIHDNPYS